MNHNDLSQCRVDTDRLLIAPLPQQTPTMFTGDHPHSDALYDL